MSHAHVRGCVSNKPKCIVNLFSDIYCYCTLPQIHEAIRFYVLETQTCDWKAFMVHCFGLDEAKRLFK